MRRLPIIFLLLISIFTISFSQNLVFFGGLEGRILPRVFSSGDETAPCFSSLAEFLKQISSNSVLIDLGNSFYGSIQSVYYLVNDLDGFHRFITDLYSSNSIVKCVGEKDLYAGQFLEDLHLYSCNIESKTAQIEKYLPIDDGKVIFIPVSIVKNNLIFENFEVSDPFESLKKVIDTFDADKDDKFIIVGVNGDFDVDLFSILNRLDGRIDLVIFEGRNFSGVFDIDNKKVFLLSKNDILKLNVNGKSIEYEFETFPEISADEFNAEIDKLNIWLNEELANFMYKPRDYGFDDLNTVNTSAEFMVNILEDVPNSVPLFVFEDQETEQKIRVKDVLRLVKHGVFFKAKIPGKNLKEILGELVKDGVSFEIGNINYIAQINETSQPIKWLKYRGHRLSDSISYELITNEPDIVNQRFTVDVNELQEILKLRKVPMKYVKNWYVINKPFEDEFRYYVVDWGDNIGSLALIFNKDPKILMDINGLRKPRELLAGSVLVVPMF